MHHPIGPPFYPSRGPPTYIDTTRFPNHHFPGPPAQPAPYFVVGHSDPLQGDDDDGTFIAEFERKHEASKPPRLEECWQPLQVKIRFATIYAAIDKIRTLQNEAESLHARATSENNQVLKGLIESRVSFLRKEMSSIQTEVVELTSLFEHDKEWGLFVQQEAERSRKRLYRARKSKEKKEARLDERKFGVVMHKIIDEWQAHNEQLAADELQVEKQELEKQKKRKLINSQEASSLEKAKLVAKLEQLRRLRLKRRLANHGTNESEVTSWDNLLSKVEAPSTSSTDHANLGAPVTEPITHIDPTDYFLHAFSSIENLVKNRRDWDAFIAPQGHGRLVPQGWVAPPAHPSPAWSVFLVKSSPGS